MKRPIVLCAITFVVFSCGSSAKIVRSWKDPGASISLQEVNRILVVALVRSESSRRVIEDQLADKLSGKAVASYTVIPGNLSASDESVIHDKLSEKGGFDYILLMRLADVQQETSYVPGTNMGYYGGYGR